MPYPHQTQHQAAKTRNLGRPWGRVKGGINESEVAAVMPEATSKSRYRCPLIRRGNTLTRNPVVIPVQPIGIARVGPQDGLCLSLASEVRAVVAVALADVLRGIERAGALSLQRPRCNPIFHGLMENKLERP